MFFTSILYCIFVNFLLTGRQGDGFPDERTVPSSDKVDMSKKGTKFCPVQKIEEKGNNIFDQLNAQKFLIDFNDDEFINKFVDLYCELNYLHPFRKGNGRIQRLFLLMLLNNMDKHINFEDIDTDLLMIATIKSVSGDIFMIKDIFREHIK